MKSTTWGPTAGAMHLADIQQLSVAPTSQKWISATPDGARNTALSAIFAAESLVYAIGAKPIPSSPQFPDALVLEVQAAGIALPLAPQGTPLTLGDGLSFLSGTDRAWPSEPNARTLRQRIAIYNFAMNRAVRNLVRSSSRFDGEPQIDDQNTLPIIPSSPDLGVVPVAFLVLAGVLGVAAMAATAWTAAEAVKPITAMRVSEAAIAAQLAFDTQIALAQIKAGQPVTVSKIAETMANRERGEGSYLPVALGVVLAAGAAVGIHHVATRRKEARR